MKFKIILVAAFGLLTPPSSAFAADGNEVLAQCTDLLELVDNPSSANSTPVKGYNAGYCTGFVHGITKTSTLYEVSGRLTSPVVCLPKSGVQNGQAARVLVKYLKEHPEDLHLDSGVLAVLALRDAFPCAKGSASGR
jgi:hypothetical protein